MEQCVSEVQSNNKQTFKDNNQGGTYQILADSQLQELEKYICCSACDSNMIRKERLQAVESYHRMLQENSKKSNDEVLELWKDQEKDISVKEEMKSKQNLRFSHRGIATEIIATCEECANENKISPKLSILSGYDWKQQPIGRWNNSWYDLNVQVVLATMAIGCGGSDLSDFLSLLDIPNCANFGSNAFNKIKASIGRNLRSCGIEVMEEALEEEVR